MQKYTYTRLLEPAIAIIMMTAMIFSLPLLGAWIWRNEDPISYLHFPPRTHFIISRPFNIFYFTILCSIVLIVITPFVLRRVTFIAKGTTLKKHHFPIWGWAAIFTGAVSWFFAWGRYDRFIKFQMHTFVLLWFSYIIVINAICYYRTGKCMMTHQTRFFLSLFLTSAVFWWYFEYLNRFVQNWHYPVPHSIEVRMEQEGLRLNDLLGPLKYTIYASLSFSTVLPGVLGTKDLLSSFPGFTQCYKNWGCFHIPKFSGVMLLVFSALWLFAIGSHPDYSYPLVWVSPGLIIISFQLILKRRHIFLKPSNGNWSSIVTSSMAALICGFLWEMWNYFSDAKWIYNVPFVSQYHIFEMPAIGFAGYLPFGLECLIAGQLVHSLASGK